MSGAKSIWQQNRRCHDISYERVVERGRALDAKPRRLFARISQCGDWGALPVFCDDAIFHLEASAPESIQIIVELAPEGMPKGVVHER